MALTIKTDNQANWYITNRSGGNTTGTVYTALVSDLVVGDYLPGPRFTIASVGAVTGSNKAFTVTRLGQTMPISWPTASTVQIIR
jgi:hypothetical protein